MLMPAKINDYIPLSVPNISGGEIDSVSAALKSGWVSSVGPLVTQFENEICNYTNISHAVACSSGTSGLHLALTVLGVDKNHIVLVPTLTFIAAVNPVKYLGAEPVFFDCDSSLCIDVASVERFCLEECRMVNEQLIHLTSGKFVSTLVVVHVFGNMANMPKIMELSRHFNLSILEDATEALGTKYKSGPYNGKFAGTIGHIGVYSFNGNKIITTGGGGMLVTNNQDYSKFAKHLSTQAKSDNVQFIHDYVGFNYRMNNLQAALGLAQLSRIEDFIEHKGNIYLKYKELFNQNNSIEVLGFNPDTRPNYWLSSIAIKNINIKKRNDLISFLESNSIQCRPIWDLIHKQKPYKSSAVYSSTNALKFLDNVVNLPSSSGLEISKIEPICELVSGWCEL